MASLNLRFLYIFCNDIDAMRHFYSDLFQLEEIYYAPGVNGGLAYKCDELQFTIFPAKSSVPISPEWHCQPGWQGGTQLGTSWSIVSNSLEDFSATLDRLMRAQIPAFFDKPHWLGYWSFPVKDPMGNTVELTLPLEHEPLVTVWQ